MTRDSIPPPARADSPRSGRLLRRSRCERVLVLAPLGLAVLAAVCGVREDILAPLWLAALSWTVLASFALALAAGLRRGDWSAFRDYEHPKDREEEMDLDTRTGGYRVLRERDRRVLEDGNDRFH